MRKADDDADDEEEQVGKDGDRHYNPTAHRRGAHGLYAG